MLISPEYCELNSDLHENNEKYGCGGSRHADFLKKRISDNKIDSVLDYGCGKGSLSKEIDVFEYDPAIEGKDDLPEPADLVVCTDVLEHIEPEFLDNVLSHIHALSERYAYLVIALRPSDKLLSDGRNTHLLVKSSSWWLERLRQFGWSIEVLGKKEGHEVSLWLSK